MNKTDDSAGTTDSDMEDCAVDHPSAKRRGSFAGTRLTPVVVDETALYAATRDSRHEAGAREFVRLHALLDRQLSHIKARLIRLAKCNGDAKPGHETLRRKPSKSVAAALETSVDEGEMIRHLIVSHKGVLSRLRAATTVRAGRFDDMTAAKLLADLIADHEQDALALRALLWEFSNLAGGIPGEADRAPASVIAAAAG